MPLPVFQGPVVTRFHELILCRFCGKLVSRKAGLVSHNLVEAGFCSTSCQEAYALRKRMDQSVLPRGIHTAGVLG